MAERGLREDLEKYMTFYECNRKRVAGANRRLNHVCFVSRPELDVPEGVLNVADTVEHIMISESGGLVRMQTRFLGAAALQDSIQDFSSENLLGLELAMLSAFRRSVGDGLIVYHHSSELLHWVKCIIPTSGLPYVILLDEAIQFSWREWYFLGGARARLCLNEKALKTYKSRYLFDADAPDTFSLTNTLLLCARRERYLPSQGSTRPTERILLVSYFMNPAETVAVHRLDYWHTMLPQIAEDFGEVAVVDTVTACQSPSNDERYLVVPDLGECVPLNTRAREILDRSYEARVNSFGVCWGSHVETFFRKNSDIKYDAVVLSGNPFFYFTLAKFFRENWQAKVILDFRDPFAHNPRFTYSTLHKQLVCELEDEFLANADHAISVNKFCLDALRLTDDDEGHVVANGFDERVVAKIAAIPRRVPNDKRIHFVYSGSLYADRNPELFLKALDHNVHAFVHIGRSRETDAHLDAYPAMERYGLIPYEGVIGLCRSMDAGIIFTSGAAFEQTTKIFDYIATGLDIVIVTEGIPRTGELHNLTRELENVYWLRNRPSEIEAFLKTYRPAIKRKQADRRFSRRYQSTRLYELIRGSETAGRLAAE